ncbi:chaperonin 10-like protein [Peziza echinospora]|nr:chaperonin 10-like protein [Peziza echinospora]
MRAVDIKDGKGSADALYIRDDVPNPEVRDGELLVRVKAFGLNRLDLLQREGRYPVPPNVSTILGVEFSGVVESVGGGDSQGFKTGDEVFGLAYGGAYAEYVAVNAGMCIHKPESLSWVEAAGIPEVWITAIQAVFVVGGFNFGRSALIHSAASSVGIAAIQLIRHYSPESVIHTTTRSAHKLAFLTNTLTATTAINTTTHPNFSKEVLAHPATPNGVDLIVDFPGSSSFQENLYSAAKDGTIVLLAMLSGGVTPTSVDISPILMKRLRIEGSTLRSRDVGYQKLLRDKLVEEGGILEELKKKDGKIKVWVEKVFAWEDVTEAHKLLESNKTQGKIICTID